MKSLSVLDRMTTSAANYWLAFALDGGVGAALVVAGLVSTHGSVLVAIALSFAGFATCSLYEYTFHGWWFHAPKPSAAVALHGLHHARPRAIIGTPFFVSLTAVGFTGLLLRAAIGPALAAVFAGGLLLGHCFEGAVHHIIHRRRFLGDGWLARLQRRHEAHHRRSEGNFGVSSSVWDRTFGTELSAREKQR